MVTCSPGWYWRLYNHTKKYGPFLSEQEAIDDSSAWRQQYHIIYWYMSHVSKVPVREE